MASLKRIYISTIIVIFAFLFFAQTNQAYGKGTLLKGFSKSPYLEEQILAFNYSPDINVEINAPAADKFDAAKRTSIIFYALPNSNTIEQTIGRQKKEGLDWHFDIQHIGAQTRFLREQVKDRNIVVVYVGTKEESWPWWKSKHANGDSVIKSLVDAVKNIFTSFKTEIILDGHSGGGSFVLGYINSVKKIPDYVKRISFLDSEYDYSSELMHGSKIISWIKAGYDHFLCAIAYDDRGIKINGQNIGTLNGGTFYRTGLMVDDLSKAFNMSKTEDSLFTKYYGLNGRIKIFLKSNPEHQMWHTLLVEKNGFIETILSGTLQEEKNYQFWGWRAYSQYIQP